MAFETIVSSNNLGALPGLFISRVIWSRHLKGIGTFFNREETGRAGLTVVPDDAHTSISTENHKDNLRSGIAIVMSALVATDTITDLTRVPESSWHVTPIHVMEDLYTILRDWNLYRVAAAEVWERP